MSEPEFVQCANGPCCVGDTHGWDCPLADPMGDMLRALMDPSPNAVLEASRRRIVADLLGGE